jgi:NAD(P)-dependent dehydrogenase (short-subunit alcohol dehydrogenase family)
VRLVPSGMSKAVLVTGASSGIGRQITQRLAAHCFVYACARKETDLHELGEISNVQPLRLDVTSTRDIVKAVLDISAAKRGLYGVVNNAGVATLGSVVDGSEDEFELSMKVNVYGPYRITKAFAPLVVAAAGRFVTIGSISGILAPARLSAYSMSKHALEAFTDSLAAELEPLGVHVSIIEPGAFSTNLARNAVGRLGRDPGLPNLTLRRSPQDVAAAVEQALFDPKPKRRYLVAGTAEEARMTIKKQIEQLVQLNEGHAYTLERHELVVLLEEMLSTAGSKADVGNAAVPELGEH